MKMIGGKGVKGAEGGGIRLLSFRNLSIIHIRGRFFLLNGHRLAVSIRVETGLLCARLQQKHACIVRSSRKLLCVALPA